MAGVVSCGGGCKGGHFACFAEIFGNLLTSFCGDEAPGMTVEVHTSATRSITTSPGRDLSLLALTGLACSGLAAAGCFLTALGGDGGPVESRQGRPGPAVLSLIVGRGLKRRACAACAACTCERVM